MKIAVWHNLPSGGGKRALYYHVRGLVERGHHVEAWCPPTADRSYLPLNSLVEEHVVPYAWKPRTARNPLSRGWANYTNMVSKIDALDRHCRRCAEEMERGDFDVLLANGDRDFLVPPIAHHTDLPGALYLQEPARSLYEAMPRLPWIALPEMARRSPASIVRFVHNLVKVQAIRVQAREEQLNAQAFDMLLVNSFFSRESVLRAYGLDARVCYLGVDTGLFQPQGKPREPFILGLGALIPTKDPEFIIRSIALVAQPRPTLVWLGNATIREYLEEMQRLARSLDVQFEPRVGVTDAALVDLLNRATALAYAPRLEPFGFAPLEANACGLPVVAVAEGGVRETIIDGVTGRLVEHEPLAMAEALVRLLRDPASAEQMGKQARSLVEEKWSLNGAIDRLECRLAEVIHAAKKEPVRN